MVTGMVSRILLALVLLLLPGQAFAQDLNGHWAFRIGDATIFVFSLEQAEDDEWQGTWTRPASIESNGMVFRDMRGSEVVTPTQARQRGERVQLTFAGPEGSGRNDVLRFALLSENRAELEYVGIAGPPYPLIRVGPDTPIGPFEETQIYDRDNAVTEADLEELAAIALEAELAEQAVEGDEDEDEELPRIDADFLDGL